MNIEQLNLNITEIENKLKLTFKNKSLLALSFIHRSYVNEHKKIINEHNERLEFLGDTTLNMIVSEYLYLILQKAQEGKLSHIRSTLVNAPSCAKYYKLLNLDQFVLLGKGEEKTEERGKDTIFSDAFEALIGAIFLDFGFEKTKNFILDNFKDIFYQMIENPEIDYKGKLQEYSQKKYKLTPEYKVIKEEGPEHLKIFHIVVIINNEEVASAQGPSKKDAELQAAEIAYNKLNLKA
ncbi:MAG: ribonuclease III [Chlamydiae bacterium RIFCSPHIGHO2_12_FULL_27_8]|nr:MAG: ribonuclease III [Chlamydiae bacterium RIFCSPHIGHO2_12_FULL_27_8]